MSLTTTTYEHLEEVWDRVAEAVLQSTSLEEAAEGFLDALYEEFSAEIVLARVFATSEFSALPLPDQAFVRETARAAGAENQLGDATNVLSLLATRGQEEQWNDRYRSAAHLGIPLLSVGFVREIPMIMRLLSETGFDPNWYGTLDSRYVTPSLANVNGLFFVEDAGRARDDEGRKVIPAEDFVARYGVRSVFGIGGTYVSQAMFVAVTFFCSCSLNRQQAMRFLPLISLFKAATTRIVNRRATFT